MFLELPRGGSVEVVSFECFDVICCHVTTSGISAVNGIPAHGPFCRIVSLLEELPVWNLCSFQLSGISFKEKVGLIATP